MVKSQKEQARISKDMTIKNSTFNKMFSDSTGRQNDEYEMFKLTVIKFLWYKIST